MIYLKQFETQAAYESAESSLLTPNVALITENGGVKYLKGEPTPPTPTHEYVDLGLPSGTLWAKTNIGAASETEYGNYYQYGKGVNDYSATSGDSDYYSGTEDPLAASADTATQLWGNDWHMPTLSQFNELSNNTTFTWETDFKGSGINGAKFTANNGNYVFFPAVGKWNPYENKNSSIGADGSYWTSAPDDPNYDVEAYCIFLGSVNHYTQTTYRTYGCSVRPVKDAE